MDPVGSKSCGELVGPVDSGAVCGWGIVEGGVVEGAGSAWTMVAIRNNAAAGAMDKMRIDFF